VIPLVGALAVTGAAALGMHISPPTPVSFRPVHASSSTSNPALTIRQTAGPTLRRLERVVSNHPQRAEIVAVATQLHQQLSAIIATSPNDLRSLDEVQRILAIEQRVLEGHRDQGTAIALAASRRLTHLLHLDQLPTVGQTSPSQPSLRPSATAPATSSAKPTPSVSPTPKLRLSTPAETNSPKMSTPRPTGTRSPHQHHHHDQMNNPLFGPGWFNNGL
jgi:hypothetical protein